MTHTALTGVLTALATPFDSDERIDVDTLRRVVDRSIDGGVDGVVAGGSTGEFAALSSAEREQLVEVVVDHTGGRVPVVAQTGATTTREAIRLSRAAEAAGADVLMIVTPYYEPLSLDETTAYLRDVAASVEIPIMLYNIPAATGVNLTPRVIADLAAEVPNIAYVKDSSADWEQALQLIHHHADVVGTFIGWDAYIYGALAEGAAGVMAGAANVVPREIVAVRRSIADGDLAGALLAWRRVYPVIDTLLTLPFVSAVKCGLRLERIPAGTPRGPVADLTDDEIERVSAALASLEATGDAEH